MESRVPGIFIFCENLKTSLLPKGKKMRTPSPFRVRHWLLPLSSFFIYWWGEMVAHWWEQSPPSKLVWVYLPASMPCVGWVCQRISPPRWEVYLLWISPLLKCQHFPIPILPGMVEKEPFRECAIAKSLFIYLLPCRLYQDGTKGGTIQAQPWGPACCQSWGVS